MQTNGLPREVDLSSGVARMSVNVDGDTEKAVDSIIERLLAVNSLPPLPSSAIGGL